jgi:hypothetical protein
VQYFQTPPDEVCANRYCERDLDQLNDYLTLRHRKRQTSSNLTGGAIKSE